MKIYSYTENYKESTLYKVRSSENEIKVYGCDVSAYPLNRVWGGKQRSKKHTKENAFVMLGSGNSVTLEIEPCFDFEQVIVRPLSKEITPSINGNVVEVTFEAPGQYSIEFDGIHNTLAVFIDPEKDFEEYKNEKDVLYFGKGVHIIDERIELKDNQTLFLDEGAVLYGSINATDKKNIKVVGYGILDNSRMERANEINGCAILAKDAGPMTGNPVFFNRCKNVVIEGVTIVDSSGWNIYLDGCENILIDNIKLIGQWRYNADGVDFCNCTNGIIKNSFLRTFDDCVTVKGFKLNNDLPAQNIIVTDCVLWCDWGKGLEIGAETSAPYIRGITFKNCNIIHGTLCMLDILQGDGADIENVIFENINIEYSGDEMMPEEEKDDTVEYRSWGEIYTPVPFRIVSVSTMWSIDNFTGNIKNIILRDINFIGKESFPKGARITIEADDKVIEGVYLKNICLNGKKCDFSDLNIEIRGNVNSIYYDDNQIKEKEK